MAVARPTGSDSQPTTAFVIGLTFAVPMELHLDPPVLVTMYLLTFGAGNQSGLTAKYPRLLIGLLWAIEHIPRSCREGVAVALMEIVLTVTGVAGKALLQNLRLQAFVVNRGQ